MIRPDWQQAGLLAWKFLVSSAHCRRHDCSPCITDALWTDPSDAFLGALHPPSSLWNAFRHSACEDAGHSLGAALALLFAQAAHVQHPEISSRIAAVYGFAGGRLWMQASTGAGRRLWMLAVQHAAESGTWCSTVFCLHGYAVPGHSVHGTARMHPQCAAC